MLFMIWLLGCATPCDDSGTLCVLAGDGTHGFAGDGEPAHRSRLYFPMDVAARPGTDEYVIVDWNNEKLRLVNADGMIGTIIGTDRPGDGFGITNELEDPGVPGTVVALNHPVQAEWGPDDRLYLAAWHNHRVRRWDPVTHRTRIVVAGSGEDLGNNSGFSGDGGPALDALLNFPSSIAFAPDGSYYIVDEANLRIRRVDNDAVIDTIAGCGEPGLDDGPALDATFLFADDLVAGGQPLPGGAVEVDADGVLWVADTFNGAIRRIDPDGWSVSALPVAGLHTPTDVELGPDGRLYVADIGLHQVLAIDLDTAEVEVIAGTGEAGDGEDRLPATETALDSPRGIDFADDGALLVADTFNSRIRRMAP